MIKRFMLPAILVLAMTVIFLAFLKPQAVDSDSNALSGKVRIDGSSTVYPITEAVAEKFTKNFPRVRVTVGVSGTGGGFKKFLNSETDMNNASRPIKSKELKKAKELGVKYLEIPVAYDGLTVVVNKENPFANKLTFAQLKKIWEPESKIKTWQDINPEWPAQKINLYGPGPDSGTFDYFTETIVGKSGASRSDYTASEDDNVVVKGVQADIYALGYFGYAYYYENKERVRAVHIANTASQGAIEPTAVTVNNGSYPLSRPLFVYLRNSALDKDAVVEFSKFYLKVAAEIVPEVGYVALSADDYKDGIERIEQASKAGIAQH